MAEQAVIDRSLFGTYNTNRLREVTDQLHGFILEGGKVRVDGAGNVELHFWDTSSGGRHKRLVISRHEAGLLVSVFESPSQR